MGFSNHEVMGLNNYSTMGSSCNCMIMIVVVLPISCVTMAIIVIDFSTDHMAMITMAMHFSNNHVAMIIVVMGFQYGTRIGPSSAIIIAT